MNPPENHMGLQIPSAVDLKSPRILEPSIGESVMATIDLEPLCPWMIRKIRVMRYSEVLALAWIDEKGRKYFWSDLQDPVLIN